LKAPKCQSAFEEFHDERGLPLMVRLREFGLSPADYLRMIYVMDGGGHPTCRREGVLVFTAKGSRSIYVCGRDFERFARRDRREVVVTIIHELLHSLGLGERPPSPQHITHRVRQLCWQ